MEQSQISELIERVDELEDLIMVEQAGILEIKKMFDEIKGRPQHPSGTPKDELNAAVSSSLTRFENELRILGYETESQRSDINYIKSKVQQLLDNGPHFHSSGMLDTKMQVENLNSRLRHIENKTHSMSREITFVDSKFTQFIKGGNRSQPIEFDDLKKQISDIGDHAINLESKINSIIEDINLMKPNQMAVPVSGNLRSMPASNDIKKQIDDTMVYVKNIESKLNSQLDEIRKKTITYDFFNTFVKEVDGFSKEMRNGFSAMEEKINNFMRNIDVLNKSDIEDKLESVVQLLDSMSKIKQMQIEVEKRIRELEAMKPADFGNQISSLDSKTKTLEKTIEVLDKNVTKLQSSPKIFSNKVSDIEQRINDLQTLISDGVERRLKDLELIEDDKVSRPIVLE